MPSHSSQQTTPRAAPIRATLHNFSLDENLSYAQLADRTHNPRAVHATTSACARNPFPLVIPCHAVVPQPAQNHLERDPTLVSTEHFPSGNYAFGPDLNEHF
ncbi:methylated-DNA--[protein]-cysteine S-methyltransferase [Arcanobacterium phocae]|uniref:methylated-DNA--[protein]-cysteine S-methyltransferase n=1 Tax=Arcanobacterium phocae TaxID=131112 RepID=UPI000B860EA2